MKLYHVTCRLVGVLSREEFFQGHRPLKIWEAKTSKIRHDSGQLLTLIAIISGMDGDVDEL